mmetsp:Transcript_4679/g.7823  ORF Transcript_4679/g.7823 Transcript_4679/m.7823 type:complete len:205 (-) Transcript_4679:8-622(-)
MSFYKKKCDEYLEKYTRMKSHLEKINERRNKLNQIKINFYDLQFSTNEKLQELYKRYEDLELLDGCLTISSRTEKEIEGVEKETISEGVILPRITFNKENYNFVFSWNDQLLCLKGIKPGIYYKMDSDGEKFKNEFQNYYKLIFQTENGFMFQTFFENSDGKCLRDIQFRFICEVEEEMLEESTKENGLQIWINETGKYQEYLF